MDGGAEWCTLWYTAGEQAKAMIDPMMLRFRPIAPKPVDGGLNISRSLFENKNMAISTGRGKRKYSRVSKRNTKRRTMKQTILEVHQSTAETLQLLPEKTDGTVSPASGSRWDLDLTVNTNPTGNKGRDETKASDLSEVESWVTVEFVREPCMSLQEELGRTDEEKVKNLDQDTCPAFISDGENQVKWVNEAFKKMVSQKGDGRPDPLTKIKVWIEMKERIPRFSSAFSCKARLQYKVGKNKYSKTVPCDVWGMDGGGFAWKLDVKAALTLGFPNSQEDEEDDQAMITYSMVKPSEWVIEG